MAMKNPLDLLRRRDQVTVLRLEGVIGAASRLGAPALTDAGLAPLIEAAFRKGKPKAVALAINSPGGSAAQSSLIAARIRRLADEKNIPVHAFVEDVAASGGYWLATAADRIHVDPNSIVGSIGVISASFGFQDLIARHGIERRIHTAGEDKSLLDPFRPERAEDVERLKRLQAIIHANFIEQVTQPSRRRISRARISSPARSGSAPRPSTSASSTRSAIWCRRCAASSARHCASSPWRRAGRCSAGSACLASPRRSTQWRHEATGPASG